MKEDLSLDEAKQLLNIVLKQNGKLTLSTLKLIKMKQIKFYSSVIS